MSEDAKDRAGVIAPPPLIYLGFILVGLALEYVWPGPLLPEDVQYGLGAALIALAFLIVDPYKPVTAIIRNGPFRWTRNPLYLGMVIVQLGVAAAVDGLWIAVLVIPTIFVVSIGVIVREERYLERKFGEEYLAYKAAVRRWV